VIVIALFFSFYQISNLIAGLQCEMKVSFWHKIGFGGHTFSKLLPGLGVTTIFVPRPNGRQFGGC
jgi:hypothetical protein